MVEGTCLPTTGSASEPCVASALLPQAMPASSLLLQRNKGKQGKDYFSCRFTRQQSGLEPDHPLLPPKWVRISRGHEQEPTLAPAQRRRAPRTGLPGSAKAPHESRRWFYFLGCLEPCALFPPCSATAAPAARIPAAPALCQALRWQNPMSPALAGRGSSRLSCRDR